MFLLGWDNDPSGSFWDILISMLTFPWISWIDLSSLLGQLRMIWGAPGRFLGSSRWIFGKLQLDFAASHLNPWMLQWSLSGWKIFIQGIFIFPTKIYSQILLFKAFPPLLPNFWAAQPLDF